MCGIVGYVGKKEDALHVLIEGLKTLEYRGYDSAGISYIKNNKLMTIKEKGKISELEKNINYNEKSNIGIAHTRWATHGAPEKINSHPHTSGDITIVHNGIIENYPELKKMLRKNGYKFKSATDTEIGCALIDYFYQKNKDMLKAIKSFKSKVRGSYALGILCNNELNRIYATRKDSPLIVATSNVGNYIASDVPAILKYTNKYILLDEEDIAVIYEDKCEFFNNGKEIKKEHLLFEGDLESASKGGYEHFMFKEINEEPGVIKKTTSTFIEDNIKSLINKMPDLSNYEHIDIVACGSAYHTGLIGKRLIENYANISVNVEIASEYRYKRLFFNKKTLIIIVSQSGETADTLACLRKVKDLGINTLAIVNVVGSSIAREADNVLYINAGPEIAVATTKAFTAQVSIFILIAINIAYSKKTLREKDIKIILEELKSLPEIMKETIENDIYKKIAKEVYENNNVFFIGRGIDYALVMEGSLKLKEISYIHSEAYAAGELKHGTISLIEEGTPVFALVTEEELAEKTISNIKEVKARGAKVVYITNIESDNADFYDKKIIIKQVNKLLQPLIAILPLQIIAYEIAKLRECDIDKPRNLAKSVTVE